MMCPPEVAFEYELEDDAGAGPETQEALIERYKTWQLLKTSGEFFIEFFHGDSIEFDVPQVHKDVWHWFTSTALARVLLAIPRDHAKTTLAKLGVIWYWLYTEHRFAIYLSNVNTRAKDACRDIMAFLRCDNFRATFGDIKIIKESETESLWIFEIPMIDGTWKKCILRAAGASQSMRGINVDNQRPDIAVIDDVEDEDNTSSEILQKKLDKWLFATFLKALAKRRKIIWLGNMLTKTSLIARLSVQPRWNPVIFGALVRDNATGQIVSLWSDRWPLEELIEDFAEYKENGLVESWMCEMMNMPGHGENGFKSDQIYYQPSPTPDGILAAWLCLDPAFGEDAANDDSSITVHVLPENGPPMVVDEITGKMSEAELLDEMVRLAIYWNAWVWGIEAVAAQKVLLTLFRVLLITKGLQNLVEMIPLIAGAPNPKVSRIKAWVSLMEKKEYAIFEGAINITTQILSYVLTKKKQRDDLIDSCAYGPQMLEKYRGLLISQFNGKRFQSREARSGRSVASV